MKKLLSILSVILLACCKTVEEKKTTAPCTVKARDSINTLADNLWAERERLLTSSNEENPVIKNIDKAYLELLEKREEIQICLAYKKLKTKNNE